MGGMTIRADALATAVRTELVRETERTRVTRLFLPFGTVIRKEPLGPDGSRRLRHEAEILTRLAGLDGVVQLVTDPPPPPGSILLTDTHGAALDAWPAPLDPDTVIDLAIQMARAVGAMHRRGVAHRDLNPANIIVGDDGSGLCLVDFALASTAAAVQPGFTHHSEIVGTVPYLAPEQTGRAARLVDQRADLYALGATLYELATGAPPFGDDDPPRIIHDHLARAPTPPSAVNPAVPADLSRIILHLLEKEPDERYQSADGLLYDLLQLRRDRPVTRPGEHDVPARPLAPSRLSGRAFEIGELVTAFTDAMAGRCTGLLVAGAPGVGKTSLVDELRPVVARHGGWFVAGKFDQYRRDQEYDGLRQAFRALGRLLLAEPEESVAEVRQRLLPALGPNAGLVCAILPELAALLGVPPNPGDPMTVAARTQRISMEILRAVASPGRPLVLFVDDLQWAGRGPLGFVDLVLSGEERAEGLLLVGAFRECDVDAGHPLTPLLARWRTQQVGPRTLRLTDLTPAGQVAIVADLLRLPPERAGELARLVEPATGGNPYDTVRLLSALSHEGLLYPVHGGWRWQADAVRRRLAQANVTELLAAQTAALPPHTRHLVMSMACLAGRVELDLLAVATGLGVDEVERRLAPALAEGLLVLEPDDRPSVRFHHDRAREAALAALAGPARRAERLALARRLAARQEYAAVAAEQYLNVAEVVHDPAERARMAALFRFAAGEARLTGNYPLAERFLTAALPAVDPTDTDQLVAVHTERHAVLYCLGRLEDADDEYTAIRRLCADPAGRTASAIVQVMSLTNRNRADEALELGLGHLRALGVAVPEREGLAAETERALDALLLLWQAGHENAGTGAITGAPTPAPGADGAAREPEEPDERCRKPVSVGPTSGEVAELMKRLMPAAYFMDQEMLAWLTVRALQIWADEGPRAELLGPVAHIGFVTIIRRRDYATGRRMLREILAVGQERGYEPDIWVGRFLYRVSVGHWFESLEDNVAATRRAVEGLTQSGDLQNACWAHYVLLFDLLDCAPSLEVFAAEAEEALKVSCRFGNGHAAETFRSGWHLAQVLRGEVMDSAADESAWLGMLATNPHAVAHLHITRAIAAAILDRPAELARQLQAALPHRATLGANYVMSVIEMLRALWLASQARAATAAGSRRRRLLAELDELIDWLAERAADAPDNFKHLLRLVEAERAWAVGNFREAAYAFDLAQRECRVRTRPWHRALILERTARFYLAHGLEEGGRALLAAARRQYLTWGATAKVRQLDWAYPTLRSEPPRPSPSRPGPSTCWGSSPPPRRSAPRPASRGCTPGWSGS